MAALNNSSVQYVGSDKYTSVTQWAAGATIAAGALRRQLAAPTLGNERVFVAIVAGTTSNPTEPTWVVTKGAKTTDNTVTWQECTGQPGVNGDTTNSPVWGASLTVVLGQIIYDSTSGALQICSTAGTTKSGSPPSFSATAGVTTSDNTVTWTSLGAASNFGAFAAPHQRILNADSSTWQTVVPAKIYISSGHAETQASSLTLAGGQGTVANPNQYLCVSNASAPPTACTTGATVSTTGANAIAVNGFGYYYGIAFQSGSSSSNASINLANSTSTSYAQFYDNCTFKLNNTGTSQINFGAAGVANDIMIDCLNCTYTLGAAGHKLQLQGGNIVIRGGSVTGTNPTTLFDVAGATRYGIQIIRDCDLSLCTNTLLTLGNASGCTIRLENCKLGAAVAMTASSFQGPGGPFFKMHNCDSGSKNYRFYEANYLGTIQQETTTVDNTTQATDGTTQISWNIATTANTHFGDPYISPEITVWNDTTGSSKTATIQIAGANTLTNGDIWMELEYLGNASYPIASLGTSRVADAITSTSNVTTSADSWGGSPAQTQKLQVTFTPQMKGPVKARVYVAKASTTVYVNPVITIS